MRNRHGFRSRGADCGKLALTGARCLMLLVISPVPVRKCPVLDSGIVAPTLRWKLCKIRMAPAFCPKAALAATGEPDLARY